MKLSLFVRFYLGTFLMLVIAIGSVIIAFEIYQEDDEQRLFIKEVERIVEPELARFEQGEKVSLDAKFSPVFGTYLSVETVDAKLFKKMLPAYEKIDDVNGFDLYSQQDGLFVAVFPSADAQRFLLVIEEFPEDVLAADDALVEEYEYMEEEDAAANLFIGSVVLLVSLGIALVVFWVSRSIERPVRQLVKVANAYGGADFTQRADESSQQPIGELAGSLNQMADRLKSLLDEQRIVNHAIAHELRTPLTRMRLALEMIDTDGLDKQSAALIENIDRYICEMTALTSSVLTFGKVTGPDPGKGYAPLNLDDMVCLRVDQLRNGGGVKVDTQLNKEVLMELPAMHWQLVVDNLVKNAQSYAQSQVWVSSEFSDAKYRLIVDDDGPGIPLAERESIFTPFARLDASRDVHSGGFGLGLAIVDSIIRRYHGRVWAEDSPVGGARFCVEFSVAK